MITTLQQHILQHQTPGATGNFSWLLSGITLATKMIEAKIRRATLSGDLGSINQTNVHGENQQKLDVYANQALLHCLGVRDSVILWLFQRCHDRQSVRAFSSWRSLDIHSWI